MKNFKENYIATSQMVDLDFEYPYMEGDIRNEVKTDYSKLSYLDVYLSLDIDNVIKELTILKEKGANRVFIAPHEGHNGYYIHGVKLEENKPEDNYIDKFEKFFNT